MPTVTSTVQRHSAVADVMTDLATLRSMTIGKTAPVTFTAQAVAATAAAVGQGVSNAPAGTRSTVTVNAVEAGEATPPALYAWVLI
ncbi:MAG: hypothetical protein GY784_16870 [Gammaproteobacteria bacterium]|nr:hypothetical protein [Gammaproteobacteria bacterium]